MRCKPNDNNQLKMKVTRGPERGRSHVWRFRMACVDRWGVDWIAD